MKPVKRGPELVNGTKLAGRKDGAEGMGGSGSQGGVGKEDKRNMIYHWSREFSITVINMPQDQLDSKSACLHGLAKSYKVHMQLDMTSHVQ